MQSGRVLAGHWEEEGEEGEGSHKVAILDRKHLQQTSYKGSTEQQGGSWPAANTVEVDEEGVCIANIHEAHWLKGLHYYGRFHPK